jgi:5-oxoprolinase (ATP-hydrolysing) subunit A
VKDLMLRINCDLGERGTGHPLDVALMEYIHIANIACGGHAGDGESASFFRNLSEEKGIRVTAHLSYPDREHFGRIRPAIGENALLESLDAQLELLPGIHLVKFHGALYNDCAADPLLAALLSRWADGKGIEMIIAPADSEMALACTENGIGLMAEAFAERRYTIDRSTGRLKLVGRDKAFASIHDVTTALAQARKIAAHHRVEAVEEAEDGRLLVRDVAMVADTLCIHSDSSIALDLVKALWAERRGI